MGMEKLSDVAPELSPEQKFQTICNRIIFETPFWTDARDAADRAGHHNAESNKREKNAMARIDMLLDGMIELGLVNIDSEA